MTDSDSNTRPNISRRRTHTIIMPVHRIRRVVMVALLPEIASRRSAAAQDPLVLKRPVLLVICHFVIDLFPLALHTVHLALRLLLPKCVPVILHTDLSGRYDCLRFQYQSNCETSPWCDPMCWRPQACR